MIEKPLDLKNLPLEMWLAILLHCDLESLIAMSVVATKFHRLVNGDDLWKQLIAKHFPDAKKDKKETFRDFFIELNNKKIEEEFNQAVAKHCEKFKNARIAEFYKHYNNASKDKIDLIDYGVSAYCTEEEFIKSLQDHELVLGDLEDYKGESVNADKYPFWASQKSKTDKSDIQHHLDKKPKR